MSEYKSIPIQVEPEFTPETDNTGVAAVGYTSLEKIRIFNGFPQTIGGFDTPVSTGSVITGVCRLIYNQTIADSIKTILGTSSRLYSYFASELVNITPLVTATTTLGANPIATYFPTLGANPIATTNGQSYIVITHASHRFEVGDSITVAGVGATINGIPAAEINGLHFITAKTTNNYTVYCSTNATSTGSGGGGAVTVASGLITVTDAGHGFLEGDRIKLAAATAVGGVTAPQINTEMIIRANVATNTYDLMTEGVSSSTASGGGAGVTRQGQITAGAEDASLAIGYGMGLYGSGIYGSALVGTSYIEPRIWSADAFGESIICTAGGQTGVYKWDADITTAPVLVTNAPTAVNYVFVDRDQIIVFGAGGVPNKISGCDRKQETVWTSTSQNEAFNTTVYGANKFISHANVQGITVCFTPSQLYILRYIGKPLIREIKLFSSSDGLIAQNARIVIDDVLYWIGNSDIYSYNGGVINTILTDSIRKYFFDNLNHQQKSKIHLSFNKRFSEIRIHYPSALAIECDSYLDYNTKTKKFTGASSNYIVTAQEAPFSQSQYPLVITSVNELKQIDVGVLEGEDWHVETNWLFNSSTALSFYGVVPDSIQDNAVTLTAYVKDYPQSFEVRTANDLSITPSTTEAFFDEGVLRGKCRKYRISRSEDGFWRAGLWHELVSGSVKEM